MLVSNGADARAFRHEPPKVVSALAGMVINSAEMVTRLTKVIWSIAKTIGVLHCAINVLPCAISVLPIAIGVLRCAFNVLPCAISVLPIAIGVLRCAINVKRIAIEVLCIAIGVLRCGHPLGCEELWGNREEDEGTGAAYCGAWERKKRVDIAGWLCLHASIIDHADGGMLFTSLLHPSRCKPTCSTRLHERSRHQRR